MLGATEVVDGGGLEPLLSLLSSTSLGLFVVCFRGRIRGFFCKDCLVDGMRSMQGGIGVVCCLSLLWICLVDVVSSDETVTYTVRSGSNSGVGKTESVVEAQNVRVKLATAEERVKALASKLDAVSEDASRARLEIHSTLLEAWNIVDTLGRDRCGDAVLEVRMCVLKEDRISTDFLGDFRDRPSFLVRDLALFSSKKNACVGYSRFGEQTNSGEEEATRSRGKVDTTRDRDCRKGENGRRKCWCRR